MWSEMCEELESLLECGDFDHCEDFDFDFA